MSQTVVLKVKMSCTGCSGAVQRALGKLDGVESCDIDLKEQKVTVKGNVQPETVFETVSKTGKITSFWEEPVSAPEPAPALASEPALEPTPAPEAAPALAPDTPEPAPAVEAEAKATEPVSVA